MKKRDSDFKIKQKKMRVKKINMLIIATVILTGPIFQTAAVAEQIKISNTEGASDATVKEQISEMQGVEEFSDATVKEQISEVQGLEGFSDSTVREQNSEIQAVQDITVSTFAQFKSALENKEIRNVYLANSIRLGSSFNINNDKNIYGNNHTIDVANFKVGINAVNINANVEDINFINQAHLPFFWSTSRDVTVGFKNVTSDGVAFGYVTNGTINLMGKIKATVNSTAVVYSKSINIMENANIEFENLGHNYGIYLSGYFEQQKNSKMNISSKGIGIYNATKSEINISGELNVESAQSIAIYYVGADSNLTINSGGKLNVIAGHTVEEALLIYNGSLFLKSGGTLEARSRGSQSSVVTGKMMIIENGSNFSIHNAVGPALGSYHGSTSVILSSLEGISIWDLKNVDSEIPSASYLGALDSTFTLSGYTSGLVQTKLISNNLEFTSNFKAGKIGKIQGGSYVSSALDITINDLTTKSTEVTGYTKPGADIVIQADGKELGRGTAALDGKYDVNILNQSKDTEVIAIAKSNSQEASISTVVSQAIPEGPPVFLGVSDIKIELNSRFNPMENVEARDSEGGNITNRINIIGSVDTKKLGRYELQYNVTDQFGNSASIMRIVEVIAIENLVAPFINTVFSNDAFVTGTVDSNASFIAVYVNGNFVRTAEVNEDKSYRIYVGDRALIAGQFVEVSAITRSSDTGSIVDEGPKSKTTILERNNLVVPLVDSVFSNDVFVTGTIGGNASFIAVYVNGNFVRTAEVNEDRSYRTYVGDRVLIVGQFVEVSAVTRSSDTGSIVDEGPKTKTTILERNNLVAPLVDSVFSNDAFVTGTIGGNASFIAVYVNGDFVRTAEVNEDRSYRTYVGDRVLIVGQFVEVSAITRSSDTGPIVDEGPKTKTTILERNNLVAPLVDSVFSNDEFVTGTVDGNASFVAVYVNGDFVRTSKVNEDKSYRIYVGDRTLIVGQFVEVSAITRSSDIGPIVDEGPKTNTIILERNNLVTPPTINAYTDGEQFVTGTADRNGTHVAVFINGMSHRITTINPDGTYSIYVGDLNLVAGDKFEMASIIRNPGGMITETGPKKEATVLVKASIINRYVLGQDTITGTISSPTARVFLEVDGVQVRRGQVEANGNFAVWASDAITSIDQRVEIVAVGANGAEIGRSLVTVHAS